MQHRSIFGAHILTNAYLRYKVQRPLIAAALAPLGPVIMMVCLFPIGMGEIIKKARGQPGKVRSFSPSLPFEAFAKKTVKKS